MPVSECLKVPKVVEVDNKYTRRRITMGKLEKELSDMAKGIIAGTKTRANLISSMVCACEELGIDVEALTDRCIYPSGVVASKNVPGDNPDDFIKFMAAQNANFEVFQKEIIKLNPKHSIARFHYCPLYAAWKEEGLPLERITYLCDLASKSDYGRASNFKNVTLTFPKRLAAGDEYCELDAKYKPAK
jgi:hypothetical protein